MSHSVEPIKNKTNLYGKSSDTEEWLDIVFTRPIGLMWAKFFNLFGTHPNVITVLSILLGIASACFFYYDADNANGLVYNIIGVFLLMWANFYDSADGQLARMTGKKSQLGRILDGSAGDIWFFCIYLAVLLRIARHFDYSDAVGYACLSVLFCVMAVNGFYFHARQCALADYYRNIHLFFVKGQTGCELDNSVQQQQIYDKASWRTDFIWKFFLWFYVRYTRTQEHLTPQFQRLIQTIRSNYGNSIPQAFRDEFRSESLPLMKWTNILTFNTRAIALYISCLIDLPWLYIAFEIVVMNVIFIYMRYRHESMCRHFADKIENDIHQKIEHQY